MRDATRRLAMTPERARLVRDGAWVAACQAATAVARLAGTRVLTTLLLPAAYGELALLLGGSALAIGLLCNPFLQALLRLLPEAMRESRIEALRRLISGYLRRSVLAIVAAIVVLGAVAIRFGGAKTSYAAILMLALYVAVEVQKTYETSILNSARLQRDHAAWQGIDAWARAVGAVLSAIVLGPTATAVLAGYVAGGALTNLAFRPKTVHGHDSIADPAAVAWTSATHSRVLRFAAPLVPLAVLGWVTGLSDRFFLAGASGVAVAGVYAAGYGLGSQPFLILDGLLAYTLRPVYYEAVAHRDEARARRAFLLWLSLVVAGCAAGVVAVTLLRRPLVHLLLGPSYWDSAEILPWIAAAYALQTVQNLFEYRLQAHERTGRVLAIRCIAVTSAVVLYVILIPRWGMLGAAVATFASFVASCTTSVVLGLGAKRL